MAKQPVVMSDGRHVCQWCGRKFRVAQLHNPGMDARSFDMARIDPKGFFCRMRCAAHMGATLAVTAEYGQVT